ncbi:MAG TPA: S46 family peptidase [Rhodomicrobium sp.]|nr:S46 family peptidase [Rhodomicrobium sp.]
MPRRTVSVCLAFLASSFFPAKADEGMWLLDHFPSDRVETLYGFRPDQNWLDHARMSAVRLAHGCSASFVSPRGLVQTNHHCVEECLEQLSTSEKDLFATRFYAKEEKDEARCPDFEIDQLIGIGDVTARVRDALEGKAGEAFTEAKRAVKAAIAKECSGGDDALRCDVVELYNGGVHNLYKYRRFQDVRLVFAPEQAIAFFGGDPDNFEFPRYDFDVSYLRVYQNGKPLDTAANYFPYAREDVKPGDLTFTVGNPGSTQRLDTAAELEYDRDVTLPRALFRLSELRGLLTEFRTKGAEEKRIATSRLFGVENSLKARKGQFEALVDPALIAAKTKEESELRARVGEDEALKAEAGAAWDTIRDTLKRWKPKSERYAYTEGHSAFDSALFGDAIALVRYAAEKAKPDEKRLPEYTDANFPSLRQSILADRPFYPELEKLTLTFSLTKLREVLGPDDPFVRKVLGMQSPQGLANALVDGSKLGDVAVRKALLEGGQAAIDASSDPMIAIARLVDPDFRAIRKDYEDNFSVPLDKAHSAIARARFKIYGTSIYPDATFTMRISYGAVKGYWQDGKFIEPITQIRGLFERATGAPPYQLPESWIAARPALNMDQPMNFVTTNDIIGGNSGSPVINKAGEIVGLIFDGNIQSLGGDFGFDPAVNRAVAVNVGALREGLTKVYHADRIAAELK